MRIIDLKKLRLDKGGLKQSQIAELLGCGQPYIAQLESGAKGLSDDMLERLSSHFGNITEYITENIEPVKDGKTENDQTLQYDFDIRSRESLISRLQGENESLRNEVLWLRGIVEQFIRKPS